MRWRFDWRHIPLLAVLVFVLGPLVLLFNNALKSQAGFQQDPIGFPTKLQFGNLLEAWERGGYGLAFWNSAIVGASCIIIVCISAGLAAYALSKINFKGSGLIMGLLLLSMSIPMGLCLVPLFYLWKQLNLMDTLTGIIIIYSAIFLPFNIFLLRSFFIRIPNEILDSSRVDGCTDFQIIYRILFPLSKTAFFTVALLVGLWTWNEFFFANAFLQSEEIKTVAIRYLTFTGRLSNEWTMISAAGVITILPIILLYLVLQRKFIEGITEGGIKG